MELFPDRRATASAAGVFASRKDRARAMTRRQSGEGEKVPDGPAVLRSRGRSPASTSSSRPPMPKRRPEPRKALPSSRHADDAVAAAVRPLGERYDRKRYAAKARKTLEGFGQGFKWRFDRGIHDDLARTTFSRHRPLPDRSVGATRGGGSKLAASAPSADRSSASLVRARLRRLLIVPIATPQISAASS